VAVLINNVHLGFSSAQPEHNSKFYELLSNLITKIVDGADGEKSKTLDHIISVILVGRKSRSEWWKNRFGAVDEVPVFDLEASR
jgi:hypothetical protein